MSFAARVQRLTGADAWHLHGPSGACVVVPAVGSQLAALRLAPAAGAAPVDVLFAPPPEQLRQAGWGAGAPILFPFPGRVADGAFEYRGERYLVGPGRGRHAIHGFVGQAPWSVVDGGADDGGAWVRTQIDHEGLALDPGSFPGRYRLEVTHRLTPGGYRHEIAVENIGSAPFPFGYGWHPYFRLPLGADGERTECTLRLAAAARWELTSELLPTGRRLEVGGPYDLRQPSPFGDKSYDDPFTLLTPDPDGGSHAELEDPAAGLRLTIRADGSFGHWVIYAPRTLAAVAIEPYTCAPGALRLQPAGIEAGLRELEPGQGWSAALGVSLGPAGVQ